MKFIPKSEAEVSAGTMLQPGVYDFEIVEATETTSKAGNDMIALQLKVYDTAGRGVTVFDYLVGTEKAQYKVRHCATAVGLLAQYERGELLADDLIGRAGRCSITIKKGNGEYPDANAVRDYIADAPKTNARAPAPAPAYLDDDIPF